MNFKKLDKIILKMQKMHDEAEEVLQIFPIYYHSKRAYKYTYSRLA